MNLKIITRLTILRIVIYKIKDNQLNKVTINRHNNPSLIIPFQSHKIILTCSTIQFRQPLTWVVQLALGAVEPSIS